MRNYLVLTLTAFFIASPVYAQRDFSQTEIKATPVAGSVTMLEGVGGNIAVSVGEDGVLMIDDQFAELNERIMEAVGKLTSKPVEFLLNTHWHGDHTGGNELMHKAGIHIVAHENVRKRLSTKQIRKLTGHVTEARPQEALPVLTYEKSITFHFNGETIEVIHFEPGHTDGDSIVFFRESNVVHMGDHMFSGRFPFIDLDSGGNVDGYIQNIETIINMTNDTVAIIPGHGPLSTKEDLQKFFTMLKLSRNLIQSALTTAKIESDVLQLSFPAEYTNWGSGFISKERWLKTLYTFYKQE